MEPTVLHKFYIQEILHSKENFLEVNCLPRVSKSFQKYLILVNEFRIIKISIKLGLSSSVSCQFNFISICLSTVSGLATAYMTFSC